MAGSDLTFADWVVNLQDKNDCVKKLASDSRYQSSDTIFRLYDKFEVLPYPQGRLLVPEPQPVPYRGWYLGCTKGRVSINATPKWNTSQVPAPTLRMQLWGGFVNSPRLLVDVSGIVLRADSAGIGIPFHLVEYSGSVFEYLELHMLLTPFEVAGVSVAPTFRLQAMILDSQCCHPRAQIDPAFGGTVDYVQPSWGSDVIVPFP